MVDWIENVVRQFERFTGVYPEGNVMEIFLASPECFEPRRLAESLLQNKRGKNGGASISRKVRESLPIKGDSFSAALAMIASLPLSDAEKADAVRRLMAERVG